MYDGDSFFTLSGPARIGLALLSLALAAGVLGLLRVGVRRGRLPMRLIAAAAVFYLFEWAAPQVYYQYYRLIIPGLPAQWVIGAPPSPSDIARLAAFQDKAALSEHGRALLFWACLVAAAWPRAPRKAAA